MNSADAPPRDRRDQCSGLQFSIRSLLILTVRCAVAISLWPMERDDPIVFQILLAFLIAALLATLLLTPAAWRRMAERKQSGIAASEHRRERFAFISGVLSVVPYGSARLIDADHRNRWQSGICPWMDARVRQHLMHTAREWWNEPGFGGSLK
jgi:membrane protein YdbS with pleckstrin-like domain